MPDRASRRGEPEGPEEVREHARQTLKECHGKWHAFQEECATAMQSQMTRAFDFLKRVLHDDSQPRDWVKDGVGLMIRSCETGKDLCKATHKLYSHADGDEPRPPSVPMVRERARVGEVLRPGSPARRILEDD
jgi:hypothetical protein